jgi:hypothetical protein
MNNATTLSLQHFLELAQMLGIDPHEADWEKM